MQPLAGKFLRLVLQLLGRFCTWLAQGLEARSAAQPGPATGELDAEATPSRWAVSIRADQLCSVRADVDVLLRWLKDDFTAQLVQMLSLADAEVIHAGRCVTYCASCHGSGMPCSRLPFCLDKA